MAKEFSAHGISSIFVYTHEAHPSDKYPAHHSLEQKTAHARDMVADWDIQRPMLVDDLEGTVHRAYGTLPNMAYILAAGGTIIYRASWTDVRTIRHALEHILFERAERRSGTRVTPYYAEWQPQRVTDLDGFIGGLERIGVRAVNEFIAAVEHKRGSEAADDLRRRHKATSQADATARPL